MVEKHQRNWNISMMTEELNLQLETVVIWAQVNKHALWVWPGISSDPCIKQQIVVAWLFAECQILIGLWRRKNTLEIPTPMVLVDGFNENANVVGCQDV